jgi:glycosyltransferase involved in cell wall biosynthesis
VGFAGTLRPHKGPDLLLEALGHLGWSRTRVRLAGDSDDAAFLAKLGHLGEGLQVEFAGLLAPDAMIEFLRSLDVLVVPSRWAENLPFSLLEAQAAGLPVIASHVPGCAERIGEPGLLFEPGSARDLARALEAFAGGARDPAPPPVGRAEDMCAATETVYQEAVALCQREAAAR